MNETIIRSIGHLLLFCLIDANIIHSLQKILYKEQNGGIHNKCLMAFQLGSPQRSSLVSPASPEPEVST